MIFEEGKKWMLQTQQWIFGGKKNIFYFLVIEKTKYFQRQNNDLTLRIKLCSRQLLAKQTGRGEEERAGCPRRDNSGPGTR